MCQHQSHGDRIFNAAVKLFAHKDITVDRAVKQAIELWEKSVDNVMDNEYETEDALDGEGGEVWATGKPVDTDESVDDLPTTELISRGYMNVAELDKKYISKDARQIPLV